MMSLKQSLINGVSDTLKSAAKSAINKKLVESDTKAGQPLTDPTMSEESSQLQTMGENSDAKTPHISKRDTVTKIIGTVAEHGPASIAAAGIQSLATVASPLLEKRLDHHMREKDSLIKLPNTLNMNVYEAKKYLESQGLFVSILPVKTKSPEYKDMSVNEVVSMKPSPLVKLKPGALVKLFYVDANIVMQSQGSKRKQRQWLESHQAIQ
jgi:hypothetical protein